MAPQVNPIITHFAPHIDEIVAIWLLRRWGERSIPGISNASIQFWNAGSAPPDGRPVEAWEAEGHWVLGTAGSRFDEHPANGRPRVEGECTATLVASALGLRRDLYLLPILEATLLEDTEGGGRLYGLSSAAKILNARCPNHPAVVMEYIFRGLDAFYANEEEGKARLELDLSAPKDIAGILQVPDLMSRTGAEPATVIEWIKAIADSLRWNDAMFAAARQEFPRAKTITISGIEGPRHAPVKVCVAETDNHRFSAFARSKGGGFCAVTVQRNSRGQVQVMTNDHYSLDISRVVAEIRKAERAKKGWQSTGTEDLSREGTVPGAEEWHYHKAAKNVYNGSLTAPHVPATQISLDEITAIVVGNVKQAPRPAPR